MAIIAQRQTVKSSEQKTQLLVTKMSSCAAMVLPINKRGSRQLSDNKVSTKCSIAINDALNNDTNLQDFIANVHARRDHTIASYQHSKEVFFQTKNATSNRTPKENAYLFNGLNHYDNIITREQKQAHEIITENADKTASQYYKTLPECENEPPLNTPNKGSARVRQPIG